jgi:hypothetical protein
MVYIKSVLACLKKNKKIKKFNNMKSYTLLDASTFKS